MDIEPGEWWAETDLKGNLTVEGIYVKESYKDQMHEMSEWYVFS